MYSSTQTQTLPDRDDNYKPILFPLKPYHERLRLYELARKRIFCESINISFHNNIERRIPRRNTRRIRQFYKILKQNRLKFRSCIEAIGKSESDIRPYIQVDIFGMKLLGLLDSGASLSCLSGSAAKKFLKENRPYKKFSNFVQAAGGQQYRILGYLDTNINYKNTIKLVRLYIIPELKQDLYLGIDFWHSFGLTNRIFGNITGEIEELNQACDEHILTHDQKQILTKMVSLFPDFLKEGLGKTTVLEHKIEVLPGTKPIKQRYFSVSPAVEKRIHEEIDRMLQLGVIEPAPPTCSWSSPIACVQKEGKFRLCLDSRKLNSVTVRDAYPQPKINGILSRLPKAEFISSLDLKHAFWQVSLEESSRDMTAFTVPNRPLYRFKVMPFGLTNAPQTLCRLMDVIIPPHLKNRVFVYLDDLLLISDCFEDHMSLLFEVASVMRKAGLTLNIDKCKWCVKEVRYLGYVIGNGCIKPDKDKVSAIQKLSPPRSVKEVRQFLGLVGWYRRFLKNFASLTSPLTDLTKKSQTFQWNEGAQRAFDLIKEKLTTAPILVTPDFDRPFIISCDACKTGVGGVLAQEDASGVEKPIAFFSHKLNRAQQNYSITELECLAAVLSIEKFREYVEGHEFSVITDHASLKWLMRQSDLNGRLARWSLKLQGFNFSILHRKGSQHVVPDALSRLPSDNENSLVTNDIESVEILEPEIDLSSPEFASEPYIKLRKEIENRQSSLPDVKIVDGFIYKRTEFSRDNISEAQSWKLWVPQGLTSCVIERSHNPPMFAHGGIGKTLERLRRNFYWPNMASQVRSFVLNCEICKQSKAPNYILKPPMGSQAKSFRPFQRLYLDFIGPYPRSKSGNVAIFLVLDHYTKYPLFKALRKMSTLSVIEFLENSVFHLFGVPEIVVTDNGSQFRSSQFESFLTKYGVKHIFTAIYSPQANSSERVNRSIISGIRSYLGKDHRRWDTHLSQIGVALRSSYHSSLGFSPYFVLFGQQMVTHAKSYELFRKLDTLEEGLDTIDDKDKLHFIRQKVKQNLEKAYEVNKRLYDMRTRTNNFSEGEIVYRRNFSLSNKALAYNAKLAPKFLKSKISKKIGYCNYRIIDMNGKHVGVYHAKDLLKSPQIESPT